MDQESRKASEWGVKERDLGVLGGRAGRGRRPRGTGPGEGGLCFPVIATGEERYLSFSPVQEKDQLSFPELILRRACSLPAATALVTPVKPAGPAGTSGRHGLELH